MANGQRYNYESPLDRLLNYTIPTMINEERTRQDREVYREELADERETDRIEEKRRWDAKYNQETNRYTAKLREEEDDELYNRGRDKLEFILKEPNLIKRKAALDALNIDAESYGHFQDKDKTKNGETIFGELGEGITRDLFKARFLGRFTSE